MLPDSIPGEKKVAIRSFLLHNIQNILDNASARRQANKNNSADLFGAIDGIENIVWKPDNSPLSWLEVMQIEKESVGVYMSGNPFRDFQKMVKEIRQVTGIGNQLHLAIIEKYRKIFTKSQTMIISLDLTTSDFEIEGMIFSKYSSKYSPMLTEDKDLYWLMGRVDDKAQKAAAQKALQEAEESENKIEEAKDDKDDKEEKSEGYVEKPKLLVTHLTPFEEGLGKFLATSDRADYKPVAQIIKQIPNFDWKEIKLHPERFSLSVSDSDLVRSVTLRRSLGQKILDVKHVLKYSPASNSQEVRLVVETSPGVFRKVKGRFWINRDAIKDLKL